MAASTPEEFNDDLDAALQWRRIELAALRSDVDQLTDDTELRPRGRMLLRAGVVLLYAHWEGFSKQAFQHYLDYVVRRRLAYRDLSPGLVRTAARFMSEQAGKDPEALTSLAGVLAGDGTQRARIPRSGVVDTGANLRHERVSAILGALGLDAAMFETKQQLIDLSLCDARNEVAHGRDRVPDRHTVLDLHRVVIEMMERVRTELSNAVALGSYRAP